MYVYIYIYNIYICIFKDCVCCSDMLHSVYAGLDLFLSFWEHLLHVANSLTYADTFFPKQCLHCGVLTVLGFKTVL